MKNRNKKQDNQKNLWIIGIVVLTVFIIISLIFSAFSKSEIDRELKKEGYTTTREDPFYKKITTNNTLDDYYNDISNHTDSSYEEYYLQKESLNFIELKMNYQNSQTTTLNITSALKKEEIEFTYELSSSNTYLLLEGNSSNQYDCEIINKQNINNNTVQDICDSIIDDITIFIERKNELLSNQKVQEIIQ